MGRLLTSAAEATFTFILPASFLHSKTRAHVRLLGPCFKTGRMRPSDRQRPGRVVRSHHPKRPTAVETHCTQSASVDNRPVERDPSQTPEGEAHAANSSVALEPYASRSITIEPRRERPTLPRASNTRSQPTLARAREKCDGRLSEPDGRGPFGSAETARPERSPAESRGAHC